ncbi:hypothetical protein VTN02DRAFT_1396 [Thermoascus thermophilus]
MKRGGRPQTRISCAIKSCRVARGEGQRKHDAIDTISSRRKIPLPRSTHEGSVIKSAQPSNPSEERWQEVEKKRIETVCQRSRW